MKNSYYYNHRHTLPIRTSLAGLHPHLWIEPSTDIFAQFFSSAVLVSSSPAQVEMGLKEEKSLYLTSLPTTCSSTTPEEA